MIHLKEDPTDTLSLAGEVSAGLDDVAGLAARLGRYATAHHRALAMANYIKKTQKIKPYRELTSTLENCGSYLMFRDYYTVGKVRLAAASFCQKHLLCPLCAIRRGAKSLQAYLARVEAITGLDPNLKPFLITFTVKNGKSLGERFDHIKKSMSLMLEKKREYERGKGNYFEICGASGGVGSFEFKRGKNSSLWHPHYHAVWMCRQAPSEPRLSEEWRQITGDSHIVNVTPFHDEADIIGGFCEVFKYALKFASMDFADNFTGYLSLSGRRLVNSFGCFRGVVVPTSNADDLLEDLPYVERFYSYVHGDYHETRKPVHNVPGLDETDPFKVAKHQRYQGVNRSIDQREIVEPTASEREEIMEVVEKQILVRRPLAEWQVKAVERAKERNLPAAEKSRLLDVMKSEILEREKLSLNPSPSPSGATL